MSQQLLCRETGNSLTGGRAFILKASKSKSLPISEAALANVSLMHKGEIRQSDHPDFVEVHEACICDDKVIEKPGGKAFVFSMPKKKAKEYFPNALKKAA